MNRSLAFAFTFVIALAWSFSAVADVLFFDTTFDDTSWLTPITLFSGSGGTASGLQTNFSGDDFLRLTVSNNSGPSGVAAYYHNSTFIYYPATQGAITNLDYLVQLMAISSVNIPLAAFASPVVRQNFTNYATIAYSTPNTNWTPFAA